ncbi:MAG: DUF2589 domain-containing protein [Prevotella sp.]|uniref:DUF2589 domain-containing protein n=2 Tax=Leyella stercorea TaxID=363265 RepID=UPI0025EDD2A5|nr:DUF2589 domain-containing protein [Prevotella sp.]MDD7720223.1 DUF2589 domain-containing protein [Leyella stercorea]MCI7508760.1 DUF2589 domain-containing protein [Prevotella sp.]MDY2895151.1 DUF2589 domain-containing protein [Prevotella sp.]MDY4198328.1 DUF2589 domain-containing protein [Prevotella sp.]
MDVANKSIGTLQGLPFDNLIGGPLSACIQAQNDAAMTSINFINNVCLNEDKETGEKSAIYVSFSFIQNGRKVVINVPLIAIVPIPYIAINSVDISFKATVNGVESESSSTETEYESKGNKKSTRKSGLFRRKTTTINSTFSTKRDSKSTQDSKFSVEATIDVAVHAGQESMPAGMAKILEMLGAAMDLCSPDGELSVNDTTFYAEKDPNSGQNATKYLPVKVIAQYKTPNGLYDPTNIKCENAKEAMVNQMDKTMEFMLLPSDKEYIISCGDVQKVSVKVLKQE